MAFLAKTLPMLAMLGGVIAVLMVGSPGPLYKAGIMQLGMVFDLLRYGLFVGGGAAALGVLGILFRIGTGQGSFLAGAGGLVLGGVAAFFVLSFVTAAREVPPIHDITTDTDSPPQFVAAIPLREADGASNPPEYVGDEPEPGDTGRTIREAQLAYYTDLGPLYLDTDENFAFTAAIATVGEMGWDLTEAASDDGRIEAVATTAWYGFKDDIVIRVAGQPDGTTRVDVRSKSRVGVSDVGANAARIQEFLDALSARTGG